MKTKSAVCLFLAFLFFSCIKQKIPNGQADPYLGDQVAIDSNTVVFYIDTDGEQLSPDFGFPIQDLYCAPVHLPEGVFNQILQLVHERFLPFNVVVTSKYSLFAERPEAYRHQIILTPRVDTLARHSGGVTFTGCFLRNDGAPSLVFTDQVYGIRKIAKVICHEIGHAVGFGHVKKAEYPTFGKRIMDTVFVDHAAYEWSVQEAERLAEVLGEQTS